MHRRRAVVRRVPLGSGECRVRRDRDRAHPRRRGWHARGDRPGAPTPDRMTAMPEPNDVPEVLFVCVHNAGRSQMAAALLEHHAAGRVRVRSAGTTPSAKIHPNVVEAMAERGLDGSPGRAESLREDEVREADVVITMGCGDACPVVPGTRYLDWDLPDPAGKPIAEGRSIRDDIERGVLGRLRELSPED